MDSHTHIQPPVQPPGSAPPAAWSAVAHYLAHQRGHHIPLAALLRAPWRCLLNLKAGHVDRGTASATVRTLPVRAGGSGLDSSCND